MGPDGIVGLCGLGGAAADGVVNSVVRDDCPALRTPPRPLGWGAGRGLLPGHHTRRPGATRCLSMRGEGRPQGPGQAPAWHSPPSVKVSMCGDKGVSTCPTPARRVTLVTAASPHCAPPALNQGLNGCLSQGGQCPLLSRGPGPPGRPQSPTDTALPAEASDPVPAGVGGGRRFAPSPSVPSSLRKEGQSRACTLPRLCPHCHRVSQGLPE